MRSNALNRADEKGSMAVTMALGMVMFLSVAAVAVDVGYMYSAKRQLQIAADAAAMAGVRELATDDQVTAKSKASQVATSNKLVGATIPINTTTDVQFGSWSSPNFVVGGTPTNAMKVTLRKTTGTPQGPLPLLFGPAVGVQNVDLTASGIAVLAAVDMMLVLDTSSSMTDDTVWKTCTKYVSGSTCGCGTPNSAGYQPSANLRASAISFLADFNPVVDQIGMVNFATTAKSPVDRTLITPFTTVTTAINAMPNPDYCNGTRYTNIGDGIAKGITELTSVRARASSAKIMVLISDGAPTCNSTGTSCGTSSATAAGKTFAQSEAAVAATNKIVIHSISLGTGADRTLMQQIAAATGGAEYFASSPAALAGVFDSIRKRIPVRLVN